MKIFINNAGALEPILKEVIAETVAEWDKGGVEVELKEAKEGLKVTSDGKRAFIEYSDKISLFRGIGIIISKGYEPFERVEKLNTKMLGNMIDCSRNAVMTTESVKRFCRISALLGFNMLQLYTEDTYEIEGEPYFGHLRGRYTLSELREIDDYAYSLGIEVIPCIQTLAHLNCIFKWNKYATIRDIEDILNVGTEGALELIEKMFKTVRSAFRSNKINIGMDEAHLLGAGQYLDMFGYKKRSDIMKEHLGRVVELCRKYNYEPMMWSDMFFRMCSPTNSYGGVTGLPDYALKSVPEGVTLVFWNYFSSDPDFYKMMMDEHMRFDRKVAFCGGASTWQGFGAVQKYAIDNSRAALQTMKDYPLEYLFCSEWGDDGGECSIFSGLPTFALFAEGAWREEYSDNAIREKMAIFGADFDDFYKMYDLFTTPESKGREWAYIQKYLLYGDLLQGAWDFHVPVDSKKHFAGCKVAFEEASLRNPAWSYIFDPLMKLSEVLSIKSTLGIELKKAYDEGDKDTLKEISDATIPSLIEKVKEFKVLHRKRWMMDNKPFGFEVQDVRLGGLVGRLETAKDLIDGYLNGEIDSLSELEAPRLSHVSEDDTLEGGITTCSQWHRVFTQNVISHCII